MCFWGWQWMDWHWHFLPTSHDPQRMKPAEPDFSLFISCEVWIVFTSEMPRQLLNGLPWTLVQIFMAPRGFGDPLTFFSSTTSRLTFTVQSEMSRHLLDELPCNLMQTLSLWVFVIFSTCIPINLYFGFSIYLKVRFSSQWALWHHRAASMTVDSFSWVMWKTSK